MNSDRSHTEYMRRKRAVAQAVRRAVCATCPEEGPQGPTDKETQLSRVFGQQAYVYQSPSGITQNKNCCSDPNVVVNGRFQTGNFSGWTLTTSDPGNNTVVTLPGFVSVPPTGTTKAYQAGSIGSSATLEQTFTTTPGAYVLSYYLYDLGSVGGTDPEYFSASIDGVEIPGSIIDYIMGGGPEMPWTLFTFPFTATSSTTLTFTTQHELEYFYLTDISVTPQ